MANLSYNMQTLRRTVAFLIVALAAAAARADEPKPVVLFDGKSVDHWHQAGPGEFALHDGMITAKGGMGLLWYDRPLANFTAHVEYKVEKPSDNSGVFVRFPDPGNDPWVAVNQGHEIQICDTEPHNHTGAIYNFQDSTAVPVKPTGEWNDLDITVVGRHYTVSLNGKQINDYTDTTRGEKGFLGLQNHFSPVSFRKVTVTDLPGPSPAADVGQPAAVTDSQPGLVGRYYDDVHDPKQIGQPGRKVFYAHVDPQVAFRDATGDFAGSHLDENFGVRWTGSLHIENPGVYTLDLASDDGSVLSINGHVALDNGGWYKFSDKAATVMFAAAGDYPIQLDFIQGGNSAGCVFRWQQPGAKRLATVPASAFVHPAATDKIDWDKAAWTEAALHHRQYVKEHGKPYERMDYGPFLSGTFDAAEPKGNSTLKGIIVSLDKDQTTNVLFDTELLRYSAGWTGDFIDYHGVAYDGQHVATPKIAGTQVFGTPVMPGWADKDGSFKDPRVPAADNNYGQPPVPVGNLPKEWCHYRGLYRCGDQVVFSYEVNGVGILDTPSGTSKDLNGNPAFSRTLQVDPSTTPLKLVVAQASVKGDKGFTLRTLGVGATAGVKIETDDAGVATAVLPPHSKVTQYVITVGPPNLAASSINPGSPPSVDFAALTHGGPPHWGTPAVTVGHLGDDAAAYTVDTLTLPDHPAGEAWLRTSGFDFFPDGHSAAVCTWNGDVWIVKGIDEKLGHLTWQRYATGLFQSLGLKIVNGEIYVLGRDQITRLHDLNGDGEADWYENFNNDCIVGHGFHEFQHDLQTDSHGNFFFAKGGSVNGGGNGFQYVTPDNGCIMKLTPDGKTLSVYATGLRAPNGMSMGPNDQITVSDNQGTWVPACRISFVTEGSYLGVPTNSHRSPPPDNYGNPICWFPYVDGDYTQGDNSSGGAAWDTTTKWGPFDDQMIHLSYGTCSIFNVMMEQTDGVWQGGVCRFPLDFDSGIMRARFNAVDGQLYVAGLKGWQTRAAKDGCFQRVRYTGKPVRMPVAMHVLHDAMTITFTTPLDRSIATDPDSWSLEDWNYIWSGSYGSPDVTRDNPKKKGHDTVEVDSIDLSPDGKTVTLHLPGLRPVMQMRTLMKIKAADGTPMNWEVDSTVNKVPGVPGSIATTQPGQVSLAH